MVIKNWFEQMIPRLRRAADSRPALWVAALALMTGGMIARFIIHLLPVSGADIATAKSLGIVSISIQANVSKAAELRAYWAGMISALAVAIVIWCGWAISVGRNKTNPHPLTRRAIPRAGWAEILIVTIIAFAVFGRIFMGHAFSPPWILMSEEGEMLAWVDVLRRGGALSRDVFCLYGPLPTWAVAILFSIFKPSLGLWRTWIFALNAPALVGIYFLLRVTTRTRIAAAAGTFLCAALSAAAAPGMSWSLARVGLGLGAIAAVVRALAWDRTGWRIAGGALIGTALLYSQEVGIACGVAIAIVLLFIPLARVKNLIWISIGFLFVLLPALIYLIATHSLAATIDNLFLFPRIRMLGFGGLPFPRLAFTNYSLTAYFVPGVLVVSAFATCTKLLRGCRDASVLAQIMLIFFGALVFTPALSRADGTHFAFAAPPAVILLVSLIDDACFALRERSHRIPAAIGLLISVGVLLPWRIIASDNVVSFVQPAAGRKLDLPRGGSARLPDQLATDIEAITREIQARTAPNEPIWVFPNEATLYFLADRPQATRFPLAVFAVTHEQREQLIADLERTQPEWGVVYRDATAPDGIAYTIALPEVVDYLDSHYRLQADIGPFRLIRRRHYFMDQP